MCTKNTGCLKTVLLKLYKVNYNQFLNIDFQVCWKLSTHVLSKHSNKTLDGILRIFRRKKSKNKHSAYQRVITPPSILKSQLEVLVGITSARSPAPALPQNLPPGQSWGLGDTPQSQRWSGAAPRSQSGRPAVTTNALSSSQRTGLSTSSHSHAAPRRPIHQETKDQRPGTQPGAHAFFTPGLPSAMILKLIFYWFP